MISEILLRRKNKVDLYCDMNIGIDNIQYVATIMKNVESLGFTFSKELIERLRITSDDKINDFYLELIPLLKQLVGADVIYNPMYVNFPTQVMEMDDVELFVNAIVHYWSDRTLYPLYEKNERLPLFDNVKLKVIDLGNDKDLYEIMNNLISAKTSLSQQDKDDMIYLMNNYGVDVNNLPDEIPYKENVAEIGKLIIENANKNSWFHILSKYIRTSTDLLRLITRLSDGDTSLATNTRFKSFRRSERILFLQLLESIGNIEEDMKRYSGQWIRIGERLHPFEFPQYVKVTMAFNKLRNNLKDIESFGGKVDAAIKDNDIIKAVNLLKTRPGELARMLDFLLRNNIGGEYDIIDEFINVANQISVPVLLQVKEHFAYRNEKNDSRVFFPKGQLAKAYTISNNLPIIDEKICRYIVRVCDEFIINIFSSNKEDMGKVYIDDSIKGYVIPQSQRSANSSMKNITRCSRFKINDKDKFIRLGIHWMNELYNGREDRTDIDLSCSFLDKNFSYMDHISYTHLRNNYCIHSGDLTNAPRKSGGCAEFVDININKAIQSGVRYAAIQVYGYTQTKFCNLDDMLFNWQSVESDEFGDIFEPSRVQQNMNLGGNTDCEIPVIFDLVNKEVIWCDLALTTSTSFPRCVEGNIRGLSAIAMGIVQSHKPTMYDLAELNVIARGCLVSDRNEADIIFDTDTTKPVEIITTTTEIKNSKGEIVDTKIDTKEVVKDVKIITPFDIDIWQNDML